MSDIVKPVGLWLGEHIGFTVLAVLFVFSLFFEFSKIKLSPITAVLNWIGTRLTKDIKADIANLKTDTEQKIADLETATEKGMEEVRKEAANNCLSMKSKLEEIELRQDKQTAARIKAHVLNFSRSLRLGEKHTEEDFKNLIKENEEYEELVQKRGWKNDVYKADYEFFYNEFQKCQQNGFLGDTERSQTTVQ